MKKIAAYLIPVLACFAVGISASFFQASSIAEWYPTLTKPTLTPPNIVFPIAWSVLYLCMGLSLGRLIVRRQHKGIIRLWALAFYFPDYQVEWVSSVPPARKGYAGTMVLYKKSLQAQMSAPAIGAPDRKSVV